MALVVSDRRQGNINNILVENDHKCGESNSDCYEALPGVVGYVMFLNGQILPVANLIEASV